MDIPRKIESVHNTEANDSTLGDMSAQKLSRTGLVRPRARMMPAELFTMVKNRKQYKYATGCK